MEVSPALRALQWAALRCTPDPQAEADRRAAEWGKEPLLSTATQDGSGGEGGGSAGSGSGSGEEPPLRGISGWSGCKVRCPPRSGQAAQGRAGLGWVGWKGGLQYRPSKAADGYGSPMAGGWGWACQGCGHDHQGGAAESGSSWSAVDGFHSCTPRVFVCRPATVVEMRDGW